MAKIYTQTILVPMPDTAWIWLVLGAVLIVMELVVPGLIVVFLGIAALLVAGALYLGWIAELQTALMLWFLLSLGMVIFLRSFLERLLPGEREHTSTDEDADTFGTLVKVVEDCGVGEEEAGRILLRGVEWPARAIAGTILKGATGEVVGRENLTWFICQPNCENASHKENPTT